jgi:DNA polymerase V
MFGCPVESLERLCEAVAAYATRAGEKLRRERLFAKGLWVFPMMNRFADESRDSKSVFLELPLLTDNTGDLIHHALRGARRSFKAGCRYKKAGVVLTELTPADRRQIGLFDPTGRGESCLTPALDRLNKRMGAGTLRYASAGLSGPCRRSPLTARPPRR